MAQAQRIGADPAKVASNVYKPILENERIRLFDVRFKPGDKAIMHGHPEHVVYVLTDGRNRLAFPDGTTQDLDMKAGAALWLPAGQHETTNIGQTEVRLLVFELKA
jgi:quercetin dioxygenase-like cupin family protein